MIGALWHNVRLRLTAALGICVLLIAIALYMEHGMGLEPCPLCILQRVAVIGLGAVFLAGAVLGPGRTGRAILGTATVVVAGAGAAVSGRHVWLENLPEDQVPACGPGLDYMLENFPLERVVEMVLRGSGECADVAWRLLGLSIAGWMLVVFIGFIGFGAVLVGGAFRHPARVEPRPPFS